MSNLNDKMFAGPGNQTCILLNTRLDVLPTVLAGAAKPVFEANRTGKTQSGLPNIRGYLVARNYLSDTQTRLFIL